MYSPVLLPHRAFFLSTLGKFYVIIDIHQERGKCMRYEDIDRTAMAPCPFCVQQGEYYIEDV